MAHQTEAYPGFYSMKRLGVFLLPPEEDASPWQGYPQHLGGKRHHERSVLPGAQEHNTMSSAKARTQTALAGVERTNHGANAPPTSG